MGDATEQNPERKRRAIHAAAPDGAGPVAYARGSDRGLDLHKQLATTKTAHTKTAMQRQIDATDRRIDQFVYELYGLTADEIGIVEEATRDQRS